MSTYAPRSIGRVVGLLLLSLPATPVRAATPIITGYQLTTGVAVSSGPPGTQLVIKGANLGSSGVVKFNGSTLSYNTWSSTYSLLDLARVEAPDYVTNLHSHGGLPETLETAFMPNYLKVVQGQFAAQMQQRYQAAGLPTGAPPPIQTDG